MNSVYLSILGSAQFSEILSELDFNNTLNSNNISKHTDKKILVKILFAESLKIKEVKNCLLESEPIILFLKDKDYLKKRIFTLSGGEQKRLQILTHMVGDSNIMLIDEFDNNTNTLTIYNVTLDYGTEGASPNNFEVLVFGLHIPGNYKIEEVGNNVVITLNEQYIDYDNVTVNDIYVMGKLVDVPVATEDDSIIITEDGLDIII